MDDEIAQAADVSGDHGPAVRHRLRAHDAEAFSVRRAGDDRGPPVEPLELVVRDEPERARHLFAKRAVAGDDERVALGGCNQLADALLRREPPGEQDLRRLRLFADLVRKVDAARDRADVARPQPASLVGERRRRRDHEPRPAQDPPGETRHATGELHVRPPHLHDERLACRQRDGPGGEPVCVHEIGVLGSAAGGAREAAEHQGKPECEVGAGAQVSGDAGPVGDAVVTEAAPATRLPPRRPARGCAPPGRRRRAPRRRPRAAGTTW